MRSPRLGLAVVLGTILVVAVYGSLTLGSPGRPPPPVALSVPTVTSATRTDVAATRGPATPTPSTTLRPFPVERPYPSAPPVEPAPDDDLQLAGRGDVPGLLSCGFGLPFTVAALDNPTGAEDKVGPEYDALRDFLDAYATLGEFRRNPEVREVAHDATSVMLFVDQPAAPGSGFPHVPVSVDLVEGTWVGYDGVDCDPRAVVPPGYEPATWVIDPAHTKPTAKTRALHLLVTEHACASGKPANGRIGPAYMVLSEYEISIGVVVEHRSGGQDCQGNPPTKARLSLPGPIGDRTIRDMYDYLENGTGG